MNGIYRFMSVHGAWKYKVERFVVQAEEGRQHKKSPNNELFKRTDDRQDWKAMIADVCNRPGT